MYATIQRWGNSQGLRIPKALLDALGLRENDRVELIQSDDGIQIKKAAAGHRTLEERLVAFYGKPVDEIPRLRQTKPEQQTQKKFVLLHMAADKAQSSHKKKSPPNTKTHTASSATAFDQQSDKKQIQLLPPKNHKLYICTIPEL